MNITVSNVDLGRELNLLEKIVGKKPTISVLANVLIKASMGQLSMASTDLEIGLISGCPADVEEAGAVTLPAKKLVELVRAQSENKIQLKDDTRGAVKFLCGKFSSRLASLPATDFVGIPNSDGLETLVIPRAGLKEAIAQIRYAISDKDSRYYTKGAYIDFPDGILKMVATDSARLSLTILKRTGVAREAILVPSKCLDELSALLNEQGDSDVLFSQSERHLFFDVDQRLLISRQVDGKFPAFDRIVPKGNKFSAQIPRLEFISVLRRLILINDIVALSFRASTIGSTLDASAASAEVGEGVERIVIDYEGPDLELKFKGEFLLDFLMAALSEKITMSLLDATMPALLVDGDYLNVVMGMRL